MSITFDTSTKMIRAFEVNVYLDDPSDVVIVSAVSESVPDGTNYVAQSALYAIVFSYLKTG